MFNFTNPLSCSASVGKSPDSNSDLDRTSCPRGSLCCHHSLGRKVTRDLSFPSLSFGKVIPCKPRLQVFSIPSNRNCSLSSGICSSSPLEKHKSCCPQGTRSFLVTSILM